MIFVFHCLLRPRTRDILLGRCSAAKSSMMINSVYGQITLAQKQTLEYRQSRLSRDTSITTITSQQTTPSSETPDASPASERSLSSGGSGSVKKLFGQTSSRQSSRHVTSHGSPEGQPRSSLRGRVNLAFQPEEPLPDISEEAELGPPPSDCRRQSACVHTSSVELYRNRSVGVIRPGKLH